MGVRYAWKKKKLYKLPYSKDKRNYSLKKIEPILIGSTLCYNLQRTKVTINKIKKITTEVDWIIEDIIEKEYPF